MGKMMADEILRAPARRHLKQRVIGQDHGSRHRAPRHTGGESRQSREADRLFLWSGLRRRQRPSPALALAEASTAASQPDHDQHVDIRRAHRSSLKAPRRLRRYAEGGVHDRAVRASHSVVLLDEVEKAPPDVIGAVLPRCSTRACRRPAGREIDFKNTVMILTFERGYEQIVALCADPRPRPRPKGSSRRCAPSS